MIDFVEHGEIRELRLNRPPANALNAELLGRLREVVQAAPGQEVGALVLSGAPGMFSAGLDIPALLKLDRSQIATLWKELYGAFEALACSTIPICAAVTGHAPAGGTVLGIFCDWRIAAAGPFKIGLSEVVVGLPLPPFIFLALRRLVGPNQAERLAVRGSLISPEEAARIGLLDEIMPAQETIPAALRWAQELLALPRHAMRFTREQARADMTAIFRRDLSKEIEQMNQAWWLPETQARLKVVAENLSKKKI